METLLEIQERLKEIAKNANITGPVIDALVLMLSESVYRSQVGNITELLERSFSRCRLLNSAITHSFDRCYSVFRGKNQTFKLVNVVPISSMAVKKFDVAVEFSGMKLVYANDYYFESMIPIENVELILCDSIITKDYIFDTFDLIRANFLYDGISESIAIYRDHLGEFSEIPHSRIFGDCVKGVTQSTGETVFPVWVGTRENYGISVVAVDESLKFKPNETVRIKYLEYTDKVVSIDSIPPISGFISTVVASDGESVVQNDGDTGIYNFVDLGITKKEAVLSEIFKNANMTYLTHGVIKSYNDLRSAVMEKYGQIIGDVYIDFDFTTNLKSGTNEPDPIILISYTNKSYTDNTNAKLENLSNISTEEMFYTGNEVLAFEIPDFSSEMKNSYYIDERIYFIRPEEKKIPDKNYIIDEWGNDIDDDVIDSMEGNFKLKVFYTGQTAPLIDGVIEKYNNTFNESINLSNFISEIQSVEGVKFAELYTFYTDDDGVEYEKECRLNTIDLSETKNTKGVTSDESKFINIRRRILQKTNFTVEYKPFDRLYK